MIRSYPWTGLTMMRPITIRTSRWPFAVMALLMLIPCGIPLVAAALFVVECLSRGQHYTMEALPALLGTIITAIALGSLWIGLLFVPAIRPRTLVLDGDGLTFNGILTSRHWRWEEVEGVWPLGGFKLFVDVRTGPGGAIKREFLGPYWRGETAGAIAVTKLVRDAPGG